MVSLSILISTIIVLLTSGFVYATQAPLNTTNSTLGADPNVHCVALPTSLRSICSVDLGWPTRMRLPNFLGHKSHEELTTEVGSMGILQGENLNKLECRALEQLKLVLCATVSPICLDVVLPPCRQLCLRAKASCRPALQRHGIEWPKLLDCRRFPSSPDTCIGRALPYVATETFQQPHLDINETPVVNKTKHRAHGTVKRRRKEKKEKTLNITTTTTTPAPLDIESTTSGAPKTTIATTIAASTQSSSSPTFDDTSAKNVTSNDLVASERDLQEQTRPINLDAALNSTKIKTTTVNSAEQATTEIAHSVTASAPAATQSASNNSQPLNTTHSDSQHEIVAQTTNLGTIIPQDLTKFLCSTSPEWLIKVKLTDSQLMTATKRRKLRVRSYRQIFGAPLNISTSDGANGTRTTRAKSSSSSAASVYLSFSNATALIYPMGSSLYRRHMAPESSRDQHQVDEPASTTPLSSTGKSSSKTYLIFGTNSASCAKVAGHIVLWPGSKFNEDVDAKVNGAIVRTYKDFKSKQLAICQQFAQTTGPVSAGPARERFARTFGAAPTAQESRIVAATSGRSARAGKLNRKNQQQPPAHLERA